MVVVALQDEIVAPRTEAVDDGGGGGGGGSQWTSWAELAEEHARRAVELGEQLVLQSLHAEAAQKVRQPRQRAGARCLCDHATRAGLRGLGVVCDVREWP
eukprot:COSAG01_NODE_4985_length_4570_cov_2.076046_3_plen_100_part_00